MEALNKIDPIEKRRFILSEECLGLALLDCLHAFAPDFTKAHDLPRSDDASDKLIAELGKAALGVGRLVWLTEYDRLKKERKDPTNANPE